MSGAIDSPEPPRATSGAQAGAEAIVGMNADAVIVPEAESVPSRELVEPADPLRWSMVLVGFVVVAALHSLLVFVLFPLLDVSTLAQIFLGGFPYFIGGALLGVITPEKSYLEVFYASVIPAFVFSFLVELDRALQSRPEDLAQVMAAMQWIAALAPIIAYVLTALFGCWVAEMAHRRGSSIGKV